MADKKITDVTSVDSLINGDKIFINQNATLKQIEFSDVVVEQGIDGEWTYRKWGSGIAECWGVFTTSSAHYGTALGGYAYNATITFPNNLFITSPRVTYSSTVASGHACSSTILGLSAASTNVYCIATASGTQTCTWHMDVKGRWK